MFFHVTKGRFLPLFSRIPSTTILTFGPTRPTTTFRETRLALTHRRPNYQPTWTHLSPRSVLEWKLAIRSSSSPSTSRPTLCTHWSLTGNTAPPHWAVTRGRHLLAHRLPCSTIVIRMSSMLLWVLVVTIQRQESVSLVTTKMTAAAVIPESGLVPEDFPMTPARVEMKHNTQQIMVTKKLKPWATFWCSES